MDRFPAAVLCIHLDHVVDDVAVEARLDRPPQHGDGQADVEAEEGGADDFVLFRIGCNRWDLQREVDGWRIARRTTRVLGSEEAQAVLAQGLSSRSASPGAE